MPMQKTTVVKPPVNPKVGQAWTNHVDRELLADTGSEIHCTDAAQLPEVPVQYGEGRRKGIGYRSASGHRMSNLGEMKAAELLEGAQCPVEMTIEAAAVGLPIFSIPRAAANGYQARFEDKSGYLGHKKTVRITPLTKTT